jgi:ribonuclease HI
MSQEPPEAPAAGEDPAPPALQRLLSRLELADRLAVGGYALTAVELAPLVERPLAQLERLRQPWRWRDWLVEPIEEGRWRLRRSDGGWAEEA